MRDSQKGRLYRAENEVRRLVGDKVFPNKIGFYAFIEKIERDRWFRRTYGIRKFTLHDGRGRKSAAAWGFRDMTFPRWSRTPMIVLHEVAHCCTHWLAHRSNEKHAGHGWLYAQTYLRLVRHFMGEEVHHKLRASYRAHRVKYKRPRKGRPISEAQRAAFEAMRAALAARRLAAKTNTQET